MKTIRYSDVVQQVARLCIQASNELPKEIAESLHRAHESEKSPRARMFLKQCIENAELASRKHVPMCQDTGFAVYFVEMGDQVRIEGGLITDAITEATARGYTEGFLRNSIVDDPVFERINTSNNTPAVIHVSIVSGDMLRITLAPKGAGSENVSALRMLKPSDGKSGIVDFVVETVISAGGNPCPPTVVGVGIGGTFELCALLAKKALLRRLGSFNPDERYAKLEREILERINNSDVGPQGLGGKTTALAVHVETFPCHMASLPVAVNMNCHAARHASVTL